MYLGSATTADASGSTAVGVGAMYAGSATTAALNENVAVGVSALRLDALTTGSATLNVAVGVAALQASSATTGQYYKNTGVGYLALRCVGATTENILYCTSVGGESLYYNTGSNNTALGYKAAFNNRAGSNNTAIGYQANSANTTGSDNVAVGYNSLGSNSSGSYNTAVGRQSLASNETASNNTAVGYQAGYTYTGTTGYNTFYGWQAGAAVTTGSVNTYIGPGAGNLMTSGTKNTILGAYNGNSFGLDIRTASNFVVLSDGDGNPVFSTYIGASAALNGAVPQAGTGITFPATQLASANANTLDDYEEGAWNPIITNGTTNVTSYFYSVGRYTKIGRSVSITLQISVNVVGIASGTLSITGLPFAMADTEITTQTSNSMLGFKYYPVTGAVLYKIESTANTTMNLFYPSSFPTGISYLDITTGSQFYLNGTYFTTT